MTRRFQETLFPLLPRIVEKFGTPFHIYDERGIKETIARMQKAFADAGINYRQYYAVKALPNPAIMQIMADTQCGFDCSSIPELRLARNAGALPNDVMFTSNNTSQEAFCEALSGGGCILNLDDVCFIDQIPGGMPELISFRLNPGKRKMTNETNPIIGEPEDSKYGVPVEQIVDAFRQAKQRGARRFGLHTMVCSNDLDYTHMVATLAILLEVAAGLNKLGIQLEFLNLGGGIGIPYRLDEEEFKIELLAQESARLLRDFTAKHGYSPALFTECGRYVTGPHGVLINRVVNTYQKYKRIVGVEAAMPALMRVGMYKDAYHHCTLLDPDGNVKTHRKSPATIAGAICENIDVLARSIPFPPAKIGDFVATHDTGAHGSAMAFNYNGQTRIQELLCREDGTIERICRAETLEDLERRYTGLGGAEDVLSP